MEESKRQKQVSKLVLEELSGIFQKEGLSIVEGGMISISKVYITPDLLEARIYLSFFQVKDIPQLLHHIRTRTKELRGALGARVKNQLRRVPELTFFNDDTLDYVDKMDQLFKKISEEGKTNTPDTES